MCMSIELMMHFLGVLICYEAPVAFEFVNRYRNVNGYHLQCHSQT